MWSLFTGCSKMGTVQIPEQKTEGSLEASSLETTEDIPRIGLLMWFLLGCLLVPPAVVTFLGNVLGPIPHQRLWIVLLGIPFPLLFVAMPRKYFISGEELVVKGFLYRLRVPASSIISVDAIGRLKALLAPGSIFCSDPARALLIKRKGKMALVISPRNKEPFLALNKGLDRTLD